MPYIAALELNISPKDLQRVQRDERDDWFYFSQSKMDDVEMLKEFEAIVADMGGDTYPSDPAKLRRIQEMLDQWEKNKNFRREVMESYYGENR